MGFPRVVRGEDFLAEMRTHELFDPFGGFGGAEAAPDSAPRGFGKRKFASVHEIASPAPAHQR